MKSENGLTRIPTLDEVYQLVVEGTGKYSEAGAALICLLDFHPSMKKEIEDHLGRGFVAMLIRLGRGQMLEPLLLASYAAAPRLRILDISTQKTCLEKGVEILDPDEQTIRCIPVEELTPKQAMQVFSKKEVRTIAEQRTWLRERKRKEVLPPIEGDPGFHIHKGYVITTRPGRWNYQTILSWLTQMR